MVDELVQLTEAQKRVWVTQMMYPESKMFNIGGKAIMKGDIVPDILESAIKEFISLHDSLRIRIRYHNGSYMQYISKEKIEAIEYYDFSQCENPYSKLADLEHQCAAESFIYLDSRLYDFKIFRLSENEVGYIVKFHHVIADGWSIELLSKRIQSIYSGIRRDRKADIPVECSYISYLEAEREYLGSDRYIKNKRFWNELFTPLPELYCIESDATNAIRKQYMLPKDITAKIRRYVKDTDISISCFFIMIYLLYQYMMKSSLCNVVGIPVLGRDNRKEREIFGMFSNTLPMRFQIDEKESIISMGKRVFSLFRRCIGNQKYPYNHLISDLRLMSYENQRLFECCINYYNTSLTKQYDDIHIENTEFFNGEQEYPMQLIIREWGEQEEIQLDVDYRIDLYTDEYVSSMYNAFLGIINEICDNSGQSVCDFRQCRADYSLMNAFNKLSVKRDNNATIVSLIDKIAYEHSSSAALIDHDSSITYGELSRRSNIFAWYLKSKGIGHNDIIALCVEYSIDVVVAILGILKAGAAYLPLDLDIPLKRLEYILQDSKPAMVIKNSELQIDNVCSEIWDLRDNIQLYDNEAPGIEESRLEDTAYIIYTSGSTGKPKGVTIAHRSLTNYINFAKRQYSVSKSDVFPLYSSIAFDLTVTTIFTPLASGASIAIYEKKRYEDFILYEIIRDNKATIIKLTPAHLKVIQEYLNEDINITRYIVGGEEFPTYLAGQIKKSCGNDILLFNEYGPTEATVGCMIHQYEDKDYEYSSVPIGIPIDNTRIYLLDDKLLPVGMNEIGEIYVAGEQIAKGYFNLPELTKRHFLPDIQNPMQTMYRTGDLARYIARDKMIYAGRADNQVKINGNRIELQEINSVLQSYSGIKEAYADILKMGKSHQICAYYTSVDGFEKSDLMCFLNEHLPDYMIPARFIRVTAIPLTSNGKIDKGQIEKYIYEYEECHEDKSEAYSVADKEYIADIKELFCNVLEIDEISEKDNYYALGGDSIKAIQLSSKLREKKYSIPIKKILSSATIGEIISNISVEVANPMVGENNYVGPVGRNPIAEWFFGTITAEPGYYNQSCILHINCPVTTEGIKDALNYVIANHASLRISVDITDNSLYCRQLEDEVLVKAYDIEKECLSEADMSVRIREICNENIHGFNIYNDVLFRAVHIRCSESNHKVLFVAHHLVVDAVSWSIIADDFVAGLEGRRALGELTSYRQWNEMLLSQNHVFMKDLEFWKSIEHHLLRNTEKLSGDEASIEYCKTRNIVFDMPMDIKKDILQSLKYSYNITLEDLVISCVLLGIRKVFNEDGILIELEKHGRNIFVENIDVSRTVGWFTSIFPMYVNIADKDIHSLIVAVKEGCRRIPNHGISYGMLRYISGDLAVKGQPLYRVNFLGRVNEAFNAGRYKLEYDDSLQLVSGVNSFDYLLDIISYEKDKKLYVNVRYNPYFVQSDVLCDFIEEVKCAGKTITRHCISKKDRYYTPSDFELVNLTQKELDSLL